MTKILVTEEGKVLASDNKIYTHTPKVSGVKNITSNGTYDVSDYAQAEVNVPQPTGTIEITTTEEYDVSQYAKAQVVDSNLEPQNIAKDVTILGVTGTLESGSSGSYDTSTPIGYYKANRNKNYPYFPLPSEMEETDDVIYMLYDASGYMCCPAFNIAFTECVCTIQKYMNTTLVSEYAEIDITSGLTKYLQFSEEDSDYSTYNYIVIKLQGSITNHNLTVQPRFNGVTYKSSKSSELIEVSGKCDSCYISVVSSQGGSDRYHQHLEYYSFIGVSNTSLNHLFHNCYSLQVLPIFETINKITKMSGIFSSCYKLKIIPQLDTSSVTDISSAFRECFSLQTITLDTSSVTNMQSAFYYCYILKTVNLSNTSLVTTMNYMFYYCYNLDNVFQLDMSLVTNTGNLFSNCYGLMKLDIINPKISFSLSNSTMLSQSELVKILNNLATVETTQTLTLGSTNLNKLTEEEKAIATAKGWTLA